ncbi:hypothetical protein FPV67DRAFT_157031 [Lyophyllum atratum]|nr:hypothetical protein FPV67DRAFT_157031 [Lyophyllum atratum]
MATCSYTSPFSTDAQTLLLLASRIASFNQFPTHSISELLSDFRVYSMPLHLPDKQKYRPVIGETVRAVVVNQDQRQPYNFLDIITGTNQGLDPTYRKEGYKVVEIDGDEDVHCPGLLYPKSHTIDQVRSRIADRLREYVFATRLDWVPNLEGGIESEKNKDPRASDEVVKTESEHCAMCADRRTYWAVSPPVFLSHGSRQWHLHYDCFQHLLPRRQFNLEPVKFVAYI